MTKRRSNMRLALLLIAVVCTQGCDTEQRPSPTVFAPGAAQSPSSTPAMDPALILPSPSSGLAVVGGIIVDVHTSRAPSESVLYLGEIVRLDSGQPLVRLDRATAPCAIPDEDGAFVFERLDAGEYGLVLYTPDLSFLVDSPDTGKSVIFTVGPSELLYLGQIEVPMP